MNVGGDVASGSSVTASISLPIDQQQQQRQSQQQSQVGHSSHSTQSHANTIQTKMSDILKRKAPPKRKSQTSSRSKTRNQDHSNEQPSVMQELMNKASALGSSGRNTPSTSSSSTPMNVGASGSAGSSGSSRSRFGSSSKTSSFLASLNPARWGRTTSMHSHSSSKDGGHSSNSGAGTSTSSNTLINEHSSSSSLIAAGNREKARQWIREHAIEFNKKYDGENDLATEPTVLVRLATVIQNLSGNLESCVDALNDLKHILLISDISPFEFNHSGLIRAMLKFMTSEQETVHRDDRLRAFLNVFTGLPLNTTK